MEATKRELAKLDPDILLLQEIRDWDAAVELCSAVPGLQVHVASNFGFPQNLIVASKLPADSAWFARWEPSLDNPPRGYAFAALRLPDDRLLLAYTVHFKANPGVMADNIRMRKESARQLLSHSVRMTELYRDQNLAALLIGGDFNTSLDDNRFAGEMSLSAFKQAGFRWNHDGIPFQDRITIPASGRFPDNTFDHIVTLGLDLVGSSVPNLPHVSDHNPVVAVYRIPDRAPVIEINTGPLALLDEALSAPELQVSSPTPGAIAATDGATIQNKIGRSVTIRGTVSRIGSTRNGSMHFINFENNERGDFVAVVRGKDFDRVTKDVGGSLRWLRGRGIEVSGTVSSYQGTPQVELTKPEQVKVTQ